MMWVFAIAIVLVIGAIAAIAVGRGEPLAPTYVDDPDVLVSADGPIGAQNLRAARFPLVFRGYRMSEVDALLERLADQLESAQIETPGNPEPRTPAPPGPEPA